MKSALGLLLLTLAACGVKHSSVHYGQTTRADLVSLKGGPVEEKKIPVKDSAVLIYEDNEKYQLEKDVVTHGFKNPKGDEKSLLYWKHQFKDCESSIKKISKIKVHELPEYEMSCPSQGVSVIYTEGSDFVSRVINYESK